MTNPALGTRRRCAACGAPFYDLGRQPISCPKCGAVLTVEPARPRKATRVPRPPKGAPPPVLQPEEEADADAVPLLDDAEEAEAEAEPEDEAPEAAR